MATITPTECAAYAYSVGIKDRETLALMVAIAGAESSYNTAAHNDNAKTGDDSWGLWQINMIGALGPDRRQKLHLANNAELTNPYTNARAMKLIYDETGPGAWSTWKRQDHKKFIPEALKAADKILAMTPDEISKITRQSPDLADKDAIGAEAGKGTGVSPSDVVGGIKNALDFASGGWKEAVASITVMVLGIALLIVGFVIMTRKTPVVGGAVSAVGTVATGGAGKVISIAGKAGKLGKAAQAVKSGA